ncbi:type II toxin-antitoxin system RelE/ParE family toxin [Reichenbachiella versicolor]|uniref:type II toxin-antitoxin system RelE/ParE family toxin n=1 Tax=Reichenbachiella versicolor TaxID=1821036 RepID=UPI0013A5B707|nr:type II toxin-antitoxin system RelE/ParE family toxin [Reichenbachiella versicolor]
MNKIKEYIVKWDDEAKIELRYIYDHIKQQSETNAKQVRTEILKTARSLKNMPERYESYPPMERIPGNYRYKEIFSYLLIYDVTETEVHIVKLAHKRKI